MTGFCTHCGEGLLPGDAFCTSCGTLREDAVGDVLVVAVEPPADPIVEVRPDLPPVLPPVVSPIAPIEVAAPAPVAPGKDLPAPLQQRAMSWAIDVAIVVVAFVVASSIHELFGVVVLVAGTAAYYVVMMNGQWRGTVGHRVVGLAVLDEESREPIGSRTAGLRLAINAVLAIPFGLGLLLNVPMLDRSSGRTAHDVGSGTIVVRTR